VEVVGGRAPSERILASARRCLSRHGGGSSEGGESDEGGGSPIVVGEEIWMRVAWGGMTW
jgi:hypothetical protein